MPGPLDGVRVVDLTTVFSGPYGTLMLGDLGADVVKVEPPEADVVRRVGPGRTDAMGPLFLSVNRNKRGVCLDLKDPSAYGVFERLVDWADVVIHNMRPAAAARLRVDAGCVRARNPRVVHCALIGFGSDGPYADLPAYDDVIQAASGFVSLQTTDPDHPEYARSVIADKVSGLAAFGAVCAALYRRAQTGEGSAVEVPMFETFTSFTLLEHLYGLAFDPPTAGATYPRVMSPERRPFRTADGWLSVVFYNDRHWRDFFTAVGRPELAGDRRFADHRSRTSHTDELYGMVAEAMATRSTAAWLAALRRLEVPAMEVRAIADLFDDPHLKAVDMFVPDEHPTEGRYVRVSNPLRFSGGIDDHRVHPPRLGEHTVAVLAELGFSPAEVDHLLSSGAVVAAPPAVPATAPPAPPAPPAAPPAPIVDREQVAPAGE